MLSQESGRGVLGAVGAGVLAAGKGVEVEVEVVGVRKVEVVVVDSESESESMSRCGIRRGVGWVTTILVDCVFSQRGGEGVGERNGEQDGDNKWDGQPRRRPTQEGKETWRSGNTALFRIGLFAPCSIVHIRHQPVVEPT